MKTLIVAKTHMSDAACVGGMVYTSGQSLRLLQADGRNHPKDTDYEVGSVWELDFEPRSDPTPPHVEDVLVFRKHYLGLQSRMDLFLSSKIEPWKGDPQYLFDGLIRFTQNGSGYICRRIGLPNCSTGYWIPDRPLIRVANNNKDRYQYQNKLRTVCITYVGFDPPIDRIEAGSLVRVSLARWWTPPDSPDMEERCYLQLSGWYI